MKDKGIRNKKQDLIVMDDEIQRREEQEEIMD
jgi:hypothetical protein